MSCLLISEVFAAAPSAPEVTLAPVFPLWLVVAFAAAFAIWAAAMYVAVRFPESRVVRGLLFAMRALALGLIVFCLLNPMTLGRAREEAQRVCVLVDRSLSLTVHDAAAGQSRWEEATALAAEVRKSLAANGRYRIQLATFALDPETVAELPERPAGPRTDVPAALLAAVSGRLPGLKGENGGRPAAVFLITDGATNVPYDAEALRERLRRAGVPVHIGLVGAAQALTDVGIARLSTTRKVALRTVVNLDVTIAARDLPDEAKTTVRLLTGEKELEKRELTLRSGTLRVPFQFMPERKGLLSYTVRVDPLPGEAVTENNSEEVIVESDRRPLNVLYMEGSQYRREGQSLWEYQFLVQALEEDPDIRVTPLFKDDVSAARKAGVYWIRHPDHGFPKTRRRLFDYDVVISSDIDIEYFTNNQLQNLVDFVGHRGGGFVMIGGYTAFGAGGYDESIIDKILPVDMQGRTDGSFEDYEAQFQMKLTPEGLRHPICRIDPDSVENFNIWEKMPKLGGFNYVRKAKELATVLAVHPTRMNKFGNYIMLAVQQYGRGRTMAFTSDTTAGWGAKFETEWGAETDNRYYRKFWQNAIRWLAAYRIEEAPRPILLSVDTNQYAPGDTVQVTARVFDENYDAADAAQINATVKLPGGENVPLNFTSVSGARGVYEAVLRVRQDGRYIVRANAVIRGRRLGEDAVTFVCSDRLTELKDYAPDLALMTLVADASGGAVYERGEGTAMAEAARDLRVAGRAERRRYRALWDHWLVLVLICAFLSAEWWLRRKHGLP